MNCGVWCQQATEYRARAEVVARQPRSARRHETGLDSVMTTFQQWLMGRSGGGYTEEMSLKVARNVSLCGYIKLV